MTENPKHPQVTIHNLPREIWNRFSGFCKIKGEKIPRVLEAALDEYMEMHREVQLRKPNWITRRMNQAKGATR